MNEVTYKTGYVAIVGRPNVGKSTLLNRILGQKISITSRKPQTTRHRILGIKTVENVQTIYVDTPGIHSGGKRAMNRYMNRAALQTIKDVDVVIFVIEGLQWTATDETVFTRVQKLSCPVILVVNKVDTVKEKAQLLPWLDKLGKKMSFAHIIPLSAKSGKTVPELEKLVAELLPETDYLFFPPDQITDRSERFLAAEMIREKLMRTLGQELPYETTVSIESFKQTQKMIEIAAVIWVERDGQKAIVIGKEGSGLKEIGKQARLDMEQLFKTHVFLNLWVKVKGGWSDDERALISLGYTE